MTPSEARAAAEAFHRRISRWDGGLSDEQEIQAVEKFAADAVAQAAVEIRASAEKYYDQMARDYVEQAVKERDERIEWLKRLLAVEEFTANAAAQAAKPWQEARRAQVDVMNRLGLLGSPVEELTRMAEEIARLREAGQQMLKAADELMTEFVSKQRAANWGVINHAMEAMEAALYGPRARCAEGVRDECM